MIPRRLVQFWHGSTDALTGEYVDLNTDNPRTDYDRACAAAWPGRSILPVGDGSALALYTEFDKHAWNPEDLVVACGGWLPSRSQLANASWTDPITWETKDSEFLLMNSAASGCAGLRPDEFLEVSLTPGIYFVEFASLEAEYVGCFHRLVPATTKQETNRFSRVPF